MVLSVAGSGLIDLLVVLFDRQAIAVFTTAPSVMDYALTRIHVVLAFQFIACSYEIAVASMRVQGYSLTPTLITIGGTCVLRLGWVFLLNNSEASFGQLLTIYPITWVVTGVAMLITRAMISRHLEKTYKYEG